MPDPPFIQWVNGIPPKDPNDIQRNEIEGYVMDILDELQLKFGFTYRLYYKMNPVFGLKDPITHQWSGMVRELVDRVKIFLNSFYP